MVKGIYIPMDESENLEIRQYDGLSAYQRDVDGNIEATDFVRPEATIFSNEEALLIGLDINRRASLLLWLHNSRYRGHSALRGNVVIIGRPDDDGNTQSVPDELVELLFNTKYFKYQVTTIDSPEVWCGNQVTFHDWVDAYNSALVKASRWALVEEVRVLPV